MESTDPSVKLLIIIDTSSDFPSSGLMLIRGVVIGVADSKKSSSSQQDGDTDSLEMDEEKKKKKRLRIPGLSSSSKVERLKTC